MSELSPLTNDRAADAHQDWPNMIGRAVDDVSLILHSEAEILQTRLGDSVRSGLNHSAEVVALLALFLWSIGCLLLGVILFLHLWLPLWFAFGVVGLCTISVAILGTLTMKLRSRSDLSVPSFSEGRSVSREKFARRKIRNEVMHVAEIGKMLRRRGDA